MGGYDIVHYDDMLDVNEYENIKGSSLGGSSGPEFVTETDSYKGMLDGK